MEAVYEKLLMRALTEKIGLEHENKALKADIKKLQKQLTTKRIQKKAKTSPHFNNDEFVLPEPPLDNNVITELLNCGHSSD